MPGGERGRRRAPLGSRAPARPRAVSALAAALTHAHARTHARTRTRTRADTAGREGYAMCSNFEFTDMIFCIHHFFNFYSTLRLENYVMY